MPYSLKEMKTYTEYDKNSGAWGHFDTDTTRTREHVDTRKKKELLVKNKMLSSEMRVMHISFRLELPVRLSIANHIYAHHGMYITVQSPIGIRRLSDAVLHMRSW